jgi:aryl-alcohol dehydrogenase-like predicted oxidoreductase
MAQLAIAWLLQKDPSIIPIPGTTKIKHLEDDLAAVDIAPPLEVMQQLDEMFTHLQVVGDRYNEQANREVDTEIFA